MMVCVEEDPKGWNGACPLMVCFHVPSWVILFDPQAATVAFGVQSTPQSSRSFLHLLGLEMNVFSAPSTSEKHVYLSKYAPHHSGNLRAALLVREAEQSIKTGTRITMTANVAESMGRISGMTGRLDCFAQNVKSRLLSKAVVNVHQSSPSILSVRIDNLELAYNVHFPIPVLKEWCTIRIARTSSYIEIIHPPLNISSGHGLPFFAYPSRLCRSSIIVCNMPYLRLSHLPIIDVSQPEKLEWLNAHVAFQLSARERALRDAVLSSQSITHKDVRTNYKDSLFSIFMLFSGVQGGKSAATFAIQHSNRGGVHILIFVSCLRFDMANHTVVLDSAVIPLTNTIMPAIGGFLAALSIVKICTIHVDDDELRLWKELLPALIERCREWEHLPTCEYETAATIPLSTLNGQKTICSCGNGVLPQGLITSIPGWDVA